MDFLAEDASSLREPDRPELETWYRARSEAFAEPPRASFKHIYFSSDKRGEAGRDDAARALGALASQPREAAVASTLGDPFMFQNSYSDRTPAQLLSLFGPGFATALFRAEPGSWQGPIQSGYGWHLVFVEGITPARAPALAEVETEVRTEWIAEQRARAKSRHSRPCALATMWSYRRRTPGRLESAAPRR